MTLAGLSIGDTVAVDIITLWKRKRPVGCGRWQAYELDTDSFGTWVFTPAHSSFVGDDGAGNVGMVEVAQDADGRGRDSLVLLPADGWFVAYWVLEADYVVSVDISTPPKRSGSHWTFEDLELDPYVLRDGTFGVEDEDEFAEACEAGLISPQEQRAARQAVNMLRTQLTAENSPFVEMGRRRLTEATQLVLQPLI